MVLGACPGGGDEPTLRSLLEHASDAGRWSLAERWLDDDGVGWWPTVQQCDADSAPVACSSATVNLLGNSAVVPVRKHAGFFQDKGVGELARRVVTWGVRHLSGGGRVAIRLGRLLRGGVIPWRRPRDCTALVRGGGGGGGGGESSPGPIPAAVRLPSPATIFLHATCNLLPCLFRCGEPSSLATAREWRCPSCRLQVAS